LDTNKKINMKSLNLLIILICVMVCGQKPHDKIFIFNTSLDYIKQTKKGKENIIVLVNSANPNYYLIISEHENKLFADLKSFENQKDYFFSVTKNINGFDFIYFNSSNLSKLSKGQDYYNFDKIENNKIDLKIYANKNLKKLTCTHHLKTIPSNFPFFYAFKAAMFFPLEDETDVSFPESILVTESQIEFKNEILTTLTLRELKKIEVEINVPIN